MLSSRTAPAVPAARALREHGQAIHDCTACGLHRERTTPVIGDGPHDARLVVVGVVPRRHEDLQGLALAGGARNVLDHALAEAGFDPSGVRVTSVVRCRPPDDRPPTPDEVRTCAGHLSTELDLVAPVVVVTRGSFATSVVLGHPVPFERVAGYRLDVRGGVTLIPTYHPTEAVRGAPPAGSALRRDLATAKAVLDGRMKTGAEALADLRSRLASGG